MRSVILTMLLLSTLIWLGSIFDQEDGFQTLCFPKTAKVPSKAAEWRRTLRGWERTSEWQVAASKPPAPWPDRMVHPTVVSALQLLVALGALVAFAKSPNEGRRDTHPSVVGSPQPCCSCPAPASREHRLCKSLKLCDLPHH